MFNKTPKIKVALFFGESVTGRESCTTGDFEVSVRPIVGETIWYYDKVYRIVDIAHKVLTDNLILVLEHANTSNN
jgi:hypothetical protein